MKERGESRSPHSETAYIVFDTESVVDGALVSKVLYHGEGLTPEEAILRQREEKLSTSGGTSDFISVSFHVPVAIGVARVGRDFRLLDLTALDEPTFDPREMVSLFWRGVSHYKGARLVDFNGRNFDIPLLALSAFRFGIPCPVYFNDPDRFGFRYRYSNKHLDLLEWITEYGTFRLKGGLDLLAKVLGKPGKLGTRGDQVEELYRTGAIREISDYCLTDVLDTYFVFLRTRVLTGEISLGEEQEIVKETRSWIGERAENHPALQSYLEFFGAWDPAPFA